MKKLALTAALAASFAAFASCDKPVDPELDCAEVYDVVMNVKTTQCNCDLISTTTTGEGACSKPTTETQEDCVAWRTVVTKKVYGVIWSCECTCSEDLTEKSPLLVTPEGWNYEVSAADAEGNQYFWMPSAKYELDSLMTFKALMRIGAINGKVEAWGTFGDGVNFAGYGTHGALRTKMIQGALAGCWGAPYDCATIENGAHPEKCPAYDICDPENLANETYEKTFVYGTFTVKYNNAKSVALAKGGSLVKIGVIPAQWAKLTKRVAIEQYESAGM